MPPAHCWICGSIANSAEHMIKRSDLKLVLGDLTRGKPFHMHTAQSINRPIQSINSKSLKIPNSICIPCNTRLTQPYDKAWETLSSFLQARAFPAGASFDIKTVFPDQTAKKMVAFHLFFTKLFGCYAAAHQIPVDFAKMSIAVRQGTPFRNTYSKILYFKNRPGSIEASISDAKAALTLSGECAFATFFYQVHDVVIQVIYALPNEHREGLKGAWHPRNRNLKFRIGEL
jgi:hypothetical protein